MPNSIIDGIAKVGGIFAILKIAFVLRLGHFLLFNTTLSRELKRHTLSTPKK
jgi:hypothetical protein